MPSRKLEAFVKQSLQTGVGVEPVEIARVLFQVASRNERVPLHLPLTNTAVKLIKAKLQERLKDLEAIQELSAIDQGQPQFKLG